MWELFFFLALNESILRLVLIQIIMGVVSITSAAQAGLTSRILWLPVFNVFSSVCVLHVSPVVSHWRSCCFAFGKQNCPVFEPIPSFLCVHVDVEMTSVVELFSGRFGFSVKSGMWTGQCFLCRTPACAACELLIRVFTPLHTQG